MKTRKVGSKIFVRHWFRWYVGDNDKDCFMFVDMLMPLFPKENKDGKV